LVKKFKIIYGLMDASDKQRLLLILMMSIINGLFSVVGIASILPFIGIISEPDLVNSNHYIVMFKQLTGLNTYTELIITFGSISFVLVLLGNVLSALEVWVTARFGYIKESQLTRKLLAIYLNTDDLQFRRRKNSESVKSILSDVDRVILDTLFAMLDMVANAITAIFIFLLLLWVDTQATIIITLAILLVYLIVYHFAARRLDSLGKEFADIETDIYSQVLDALKIQREIKLAQKQDHFLGRYTRIFNRMINNRLRYELISLIPQRVIEVVAFGSILLIAVYFSVYETQNLSAITVIGMYAFATYRLMPAISDIFDSFEQIQFSSAILKRLANEFKSPTVSENRSPVATIQSSIQLRDLSFNFGVDSPFRLERLSLQFYANQFNCILGKTGCGKTTLLNILAGLYKPGGGQILIDQQPCELYHNKSWQSRLGLVPAQVELVAATIAENIALGTAKKQIDWQRLEQVTKIVALNEHISQLPQQFNTVYGEHGMTFSSGQIQKLGIARALYHQPSLLLLDEATDALDIASEAQLITQLKSLDELTIIFVSHRPSIQQLADHTFDLEALLQGQ